MRRSIDRKPVAVLLLWLWLLTPSWLAAQDVAPGLDGRLIQSVTFPGSQELDDGLLSPRLVTRETRCRGVLLVPFCWLIDWEVLIERHRLVAEDLPLDRLRLQVLYFRAGFREAAVTSEVVEVSDGVEVRFRIEEGPPTLLRELEVRQEEEILRPRDLRGAGLPREGHPLNLDHLEEGIEAVRALLAARGFLDVVITDSIEVVGGEARLELVIDPGRRATVRGFEITGNEEVAEGTIVGALHLEEGGLLTTTLVQRSRSALHQSNLFHEADVVVPEQVDSAKVVVVRLREAPPRLGRVGGGVNTMEFGQLEGRYTHYNWLGGGRRFDTRGSLGNLLAPQLNDRFIFGDILPGDLAGIDESPFEKPTWRLSAEFSQPHFRAVENSLSLSLFTHRRVIPAISVERGFGGEATVTHRPRFRSSISLTYRYEINSISAGDVFFCVTFGICEIEAIDALRGSNRLSPLALNVHLDRSDDPLGPTSGYRARLDLEHASGLTLSQFRHNRISGEVSYYQPFGAEPRHVVAGRVRVGWVRSLGGTVRALGLGEGDAFLHPRKRFFAGGARSVRGYAENQLGPRVLTIPRAELLEEDRCTAGEIDDGTCDPALAPVDAFLPRPLGGNSVLEGSLEYRFPIGSTFGALFVDGAIVGGRIGGFLQDPGMGVTPGLGVRFSSPAGPIRIDLGLRPRTAPHLPVVTEADPEPANEVIDRRLVVLDRRRRFDPLEDMGWLARTLSRLTLHFSIGEAF